MEGIIAAIITGVLSLIGVVISNIAANAKMSKELEKAQAVTDTKIEELTREVREHNNFAKRVPVLEEKAKVADHRISDLEHINQKDLGGITMKKINIKGVTAQTWARTLVLLLALISQLAVILGKRSEAIDIDRWQEYVTYAFTALAAVVSWWKNNSFTDKAQDADNVLNGGNDNG